MSHASRHRLPISRPMWLAGAILLIIATVLSAYLVERHLRGLEVAGCGIGSGCDSAVNGPWGRIPGLDYPISHVGAAYFAALLVAWGIARGLPGLMLPVVRLGAGVSVMLLGVMLANGYFCAYCIGIHACNLLFWLIGERATFGVRPTAFGSGGGAALAAVFLLGTIGLGIAEFAKRGAVAAGDEQKLTDATQRMIEGAAADEGELADPEAETGSGGAAGFTGRWRLGPAVAPIRVVLWTDYQCPDCRGIEQDISAIFHERDDMSLSVKHFPFCQDCNPHLRETLHPNACWAARAAETAGILGGEEAFWAMHEWLFEHKGSFEYEPLRAHVIARGFDFDEWTATMTGAETLDRVRADIDEAIGYGIEQTPFIFINGVELKGWRVLNGVRRAIETLAATNPPARPATVDRPPTAVDAALRSWRNAAPATLVPDAHAWPLGNPGGAVRVTVFGSYDEPFTGMVDDIITSFMSGRDDVRYDFRHYPIDEVCNPHASQTLQKEGCRMATAVEAAGVLGGREAYARMHAWLFANARLFTDSHLRDGAASLGLDAAALFEAMARPDVDAAIVDDCDAARAAGIRGIPLIYVNDKLLPKWKFGDREALTAVLEDAAGE